ncbi:hypothetical protein GQ56_0137030 [Burkholderia paludis]|uniref:hypothetical protein n=1 Tax=Burkholderia paludis TaxID=1506587 RepID=UPI0004DB7959|nr:hypothetical protein [Burkholderia paludis]KFG92487.1 hypothetical protein GQ56_0137030 [Burkholderia paludis]
MFDRNRCLPDRTDPEPFDAVRQENRRQEDRIEPIAPENDARPAVIVAQGALLANRYAASRCTRDIASGRAR